MIHRQSVFPASLAFPLAQYDNPRAVIQVGKHDDVVHRIQRLQVKNGRLLFLTSGGAPLLFAMK